MFFLILRVVSKATVSGPSLVISIVDLSPDIHINITVAAAACILQAIFGDPFGTVVR